MKRATSGETFIIKILYPSVRSAIIRKYEEKRENLAKQLLQRDNKTIEECGLFICEELSYLSATPDGITSTFNKNDSYF